MEYTFCARSRRAISFIVRSRLRVSAVAHLDPPAGVGQRNAAPVPCLQPTSFHSVADDALKLPGCPDAAPYADHQDRPPLHRLAPRVVSEDSTKARRESVERWSVHDWASLWMSEPNLYPHGLPVIDRRRQSIDP